MQVASGQIKELDVHKSLKAVAQCTFPTRFHSPRHQTYDGIRICAIWPPSKQVRLCGVALLVPLVNAIVQDYRTSDFDVNLVGIQTKLCAGCLDE